MEREIPAPEVGETVYIPNSLHLGHGEDDIRGGKDCVSAVSLEVSAGKPEPFIETKSCPGLWYNWRFLALEQRRLKTIFGDHWASPNSHHDGDWREFF